MTLIVLHIPKTGGTSLRRALTGPKVVALTAANIGRYYNENLPREMGKVEKDSRNVVIGHFPYGVHKHLDGPYRYATVLRHPAERVFSDFRYTKGVSKGGHAHNGAQFTTSLDRFLTAYWLGSNLMVRQLSGLGFAFKGKVDDSHLELAMANLRTIEYVGLTRAMDDFYARIQKAYGFTAKLGVVNKGVGANVATMDRRVVAQILEHNQLDLVLYEVAKEMANV